MNRWDGKKVKDWGMYLGRRCLVVEDRPLPINCEVKVLEVAPSGKFVKFGFPSGDESWEDCSEWLLVEELKE